MKQLKSFGAFWYDFIVGDDWHVAALVVAGLALTAIVTHAARVNAWWLLPVFAVAALVWSLHRATAKKLKTSEGSAGRQSYAPRKRTGSSVSVAPPSPSGSTR
jgi:hypothetical protein